MHGMEVGHGWRLDFPCCELGLLTCLRFGFMWPTSKQEQAHCRYLKASTWGNHSTSQRKPGSSTTHMFKIWFHVAKV